MMLKPYTVYEIAEKIEECVDNARDSKGHGVDSALDDLMSLVGDLYEHKAQVLKLINNKKEIVKVWRWNIKKEGQKGSLWIAKNL